MQTLNAHSPREAPLMSGAIGVVPYRVDVRIGDDALATQTQPSDGRSLSNQNVCQRSTTPDSMLLDAEECRLQNSGQTNSHNVSCRSRASPCSGDPSMDCFRRSQSTRSSYTKDASSHPHRAVSEEVSLQQHAFAGRSDDSQGIANQLTESEKPATGHQKGEDAWRALLALPSDSSKSMARVGSIPSNQSMRSTQLWKQAPQDFDCGIDPELRSTEIGGPTHTARTHNSTVRSSCLPGNASEQYRHCLRDVLGENIEPLQHVGEILQNPLTTRDDEIWKQFVFGDPSHCNLDALLSHDIPQQANKDMPRGSAWSIAASASRSPSLDSRAKVSEAPTEIATDCNILEAGCSVASEDALVAAGSTYNNVPNSQLTALSKRQKYQSAIKSSIEDSASSLPAISESRLGGRVFSSSIPVKLGTKDCRTQMLNWDGKGGGEEPLILNKVNPDGRTETT